MMIFNRYFDPEDFAAGKFVSIGVSAGNAAKSDSVCRPGMRARPVIKSQRDCDTLDAVIDPNLEHCK